MAARQQSLPRDGRRLGWGDTVAKSVILNEAKRSEESHRATLHEAMWSLSLLTRVASYGDQIGAQSSESLSVSCTTPLPSAFIT